MAVDTEGGDALDDVFSSSRDRGADSAAPEPEAAPKAPPPEAKADEPQGKLADDSSPKGNRDPETGRFVPLTELKSERSKRQEEARLRTESEQRAIRAEAELEAYRRLLDQQKAPQQQQQQPEVQEPDPLLNPKEWADHVRAQIRAEMMATDYRNRVASSEAMARSKYQDFDKMSEIFVAAAQQYPHLRQQVLNAPMPAEFAYQTAKRLVFEHKMGGDPDAYEKRIREEERNKVTQELKAGPPQQQRFPGTLADAPAAGGQGQNLSDSAMLGDIFSSNRRSRARA